MRIKQSLILPLTILAALLATALLIRGVRAANITVDTTGDGVVEDDNCTLREAIIAANEDRAVDACAAGNGDDTIILPAGEYILNTAGDGEDAALTGDLDITEDLTINGAGRNNTLINGLGLDRIFHIVAQSPIRAAGGTEGSASATGGGGSATEGGASATEGSGMGSTVHFSGLTIASGEVADYGGAMYVDAGRVTFTDSRIGFNAAGNSGGGIMGSGELRLVNTIMIDNISVNGTGGAIYWGSGSLTLINSRLTENSAVLGGGIYGVVGQITLEGSRVDNNSANNGPGSNGGGIHLSSGATLTATNSRLDGNNADGTGGAAFVSEASIVLNGSRVQDNTAGASGGGIYVYEGQLTVQNSEVSGNSAGAGAGLYANRSPLTVVNSTISGNSTVGSGGGITAVLAPSTLHNVTITGNTADSDADGFGDGGGISSVNEELDIMNSIIAGNVDDSGTGDVFPDCSADLHSLGYNLVEDTTGCTISGDTTGNLTGVAPLLGPLQSNGGPTHTHALLAGSPAIDAGDPDGCRDEAGDPLAIDQRGYIRPVDGDADNDARCDIGAYEYDSPGPPTPTPTPTATSTPTNTPTVSPTPTSSPTVSPTPAPDSNYHYLPLIHK